jgi:dTDP-4-amino-4,6-dideoxygalactose transaminase
MRTTKQEKKVLEQTLADMHGRKHCVFVSRGTVACYAALMGLEHTSGTVIMPSILCMSVANAVIYAGLRPLFCDVQRADFTIDPKSLEELLKSEKDVRAVIVPHMYGHPAKIVQIEKLTKQYGAVLIEDVAQALGGTVGDRPLGSFGEFAVLSFGHTKIIDEGGGGALLFDDDTYYARIQKCIQSIPDRGRTYEGLGALYRKAYYAIATIVRDDARCASLYSSFPPIFKNLYLFKDFEGRLPERIENALTDLTRIITKRNEHAQYYKEHLLHKDIIHPRVAKGGVSWRYSFLVRGANQQKIAEEVRKHGIDISNWYPPLHLMYGSGLKSLKSAEYIGSHIFNMWVDQNLTTKDLQRNTEVVIDAIKKHGGE